MKSGTPSSAVVSHGLTKRILIGMVAGLIVGVVLNVLISPERIDGELVFADNFAGRVFGGVVVDGLLGATGEIFIALLRMLVVPIVLISLVCGTASLDNIARLGRVGLKTLGFYLFTTAIAITLALFFASIFQPGAAFELTASEADYQGVGAPSLKEIIVGMFPTNPMAALAQGNMLQIIVFAILFGASLSLIGEPGKRLLAVFEDLNVAVLKLVNLVIYAAPVGVFALVASTFATQGFSAFLPLLGYFFLLVFVLVFHAGVTYSALLALLGRLNPIVFFRKMRANQVFAFSTSSSSATIPVTLETVEEKLGVKNTVASFTVPLGATINMDGTAIMQGVATVFIAQAYGIPLGLEAFLLVILTATLASIGTAGVPGVGLIMLTMVLDQAGLPIKGEAMTMIFAVDRLLDMTRTAVNVTGDAAVSCIVAKSEGELDEAVFNAE